MPSDLIGGDKKNDKLKLILCGSKKNNYSKIDKYIKKNDLNKKKINLLFISKRF